MSDGQQDGIRASQPRPHGRDVDARPSHRAVPATAQRQKLARAGTMILLVLALAMLCGLIGAAIALLVHPLRDGTDLSVRSSPARSGVNLPISSVEEVAAKVLPSVVTLQSEVGGQSYLGSGIVLTPGGPATSAHHALAPHRPAGALGNPDEHPARSKVRPAGRTALGPPFIGVSWAAQIWRAGSTSSRQIQPRMRGPTCAHTLTQRGFRKGKG
jgi:hypothetical protein